MGPHQCARPVVVARGVADGLSGCRCPSGRSRRRLAEAARLLAIALAVFLAVLPLLWVLLASFKLPADVAQLPPRLLFTPTLQNYLQVLDAGFASFFRNSVLITLGAVALSVGLGVPAAYGFSRLKVPAARALLLFVLSMRFVPYIVFAVPLFVMLVRLRLVGTHGALIVVYILINLPLVLSGRAAQTLPVVLTRFLGGMEDPVRWGLLSASSVVVLAPVVVVTLLVHRYVRAGFGGGAN